MMSNQMELGLSPIEDVIADAKAGKLFILVDDQNRENEGDLCIIGSHADAHAVNFMAKYGRGLICLALTKERIEKLGLSMMEGAMNRVTRPPLLSLSKRVTGLPLEFQPMTVQQLFRLPLTRK